MSFQAAKSKKDGKCITQRHADWAINRGICEYIYVLNVKRPEDLLDKIRFHYPRTAVAIINFT